MSWNWLRPAVLFLSVTALTVITTGCAEERDPINRVQPDALAKSFFVGADLVNDVDNPSFYANGTLLDIGYGASQDGLFSGFYSNDLSVIRWQITEDLLLGRLAFERIDNSDGKGAGKETNDGQVLYVFNIIKHFDIRHSYNPSTGEELNVIEENSSDRPWYQREYMRVDWSQNLNTDSYDFDTAAVYGTLFGVSYEPIAYYINDPSHPHAPNFEPAEGYFDITTKAYAKPGMVDLRHLGWGIDEYPACFLGADISGGKAPAANCNPHEITVRHSFWKQQDTDYEAQDWDGYRFQAFGAFTKQRNGFARNYGMSDNKWRRFISRYNIWERSHRYADMDAMTGPVECFKPCEAGQDPNAGQCTPSDGDPKRDIDGNGTHDECEAAGAGSRCNIFAQKCTVPYRERTVRPIVWYYSKGSDNRYYEPTVWATREWDAAMRMAVLAAKNVECHRDLTQDPNIDCDVVHPVPHGQMTLERDAVEILSEVEECLLDQGTWKLAGSGCEPIIDAHLVARGYDQGTIEYIELSAVLNMDQVVVLCHSPTEAADHPLCTPGKPRLPSSVSAWDCQNARMDGGDAATRATCDAAYGVRIGDVRRHLVNVVTNPETPSPWGFGPTYANPLTGEAISASINLWANPTERIAQATLDQVRFIGGELRVDEVTDGTYVKDWEKAADLARGGGALGHMTKHEHDKRLKAAFRGSFRDLATGANEEAVAEQGVQGRGSLAEQLPPQLLEKLDKLRHVKDVRASVNAPSTMAPEYLARLRMGHGTATEAALTTGPMMQLAGVDKLGAAAAAGLASPLRGNFNPTMRRQLSHIKEANLAERGACMLNAEDFAPSPTAMVGLTKLLQAKFGTLNPDDPKSVQLERAAKMQHYLASKMHTAVIIHEMGHTFGYRHNFVSSSSAINYRPQYWQLRTRNGQVTDVCQDLTADDNEAANCIGPRYYDQYTQEEQEQLLPTWQHSSVMDYAGDYTQDMLGLGGYDFHAARMFYGESTAVFADADLNEGTALSGALTETVMDNFGGILGYLYQDAPSDFPNDNHNIHYSELNRVYNLINDCQDIDPEAFRPTYWDEEKMGTWSPLLDGLLVQVDGKYSRCKQRRVAYVGWDELRESGISNYNSPRAIDRQGRTRVPTAFATDTWADLGNLSVYRHDNGADPYEIFNFFVTEQELRHIFDNYRRDRQGFSVRSASGRILGRYNEKMRDGAKGLGLVKNNLFDTGAEVGIIGETFFETYVGFLNWGDNMLASGLAFDHFARQMQRPQIGGYDDPSVNPPNDLNPNMEVTLIANETGSGVVLVPDGPQGFWNSVGIGGKLVNNDLSDDNGEYDTRYTENAGSYYDKIYTTMLLTESVDNFVSSSLDDFVDSRRRAVSIADLFPDGYRRWLANNLTLDSFLKGPRVAADINGNVLTDADRFPAQPMGWTSWWGDAPEICFASAGTTVCRAPNSDSATFNADIPPGSRPVDPQIGWEQHKFLIANTLIYLPSNQKQLWMDMMGIWSLGDDSDPGFQNRIELHVPNGDVYIARTYGTEEICFEKCVTVQRGIGARILEYANQLLEAAYETTPVTQFGTTWYVPVINTDGAPIVLFDPGMTWLTPDFRGAPPPADCSANDNSGCKCEHNAACVGLTNYISVPDFMRQAMRDFGLADPTMKGIY